MHQLLDRLIDAELGARILSMKTLHGGAVGQVFDVRLDRPSPQKSVCAKLVVDEPQVPYAEDPLNDRVYGMRLDNYDGARRLLDSCLSVPQLFSDGTILDEQSGTRWRYWIMELLEGHTEIDWTRGTHPDPSGIHHCAGRTLAGMHQMTRRYPGWADLPEAESWKYGPALFHTLRYEVGKAAEAKMLKAAEYEELLSFSDREEADWSDPDLFCFSHPDGLQGFFCSDSAGWRFAGVVDIEDHMYTDPRFSLSGLDLQARLQGASLPESFREGYTSVRPWPAGLDQCRPVYQVLFLCTWSYVTDQRRLAERALQVARGVW